MSLGQKSISIICSAAILLSFNLRAHASEALSPVDKTTVKSASDTFKSILDDAKRKGLVKPKNNEPVLDTKPNQNLNIKDTSVDCSDLKVLDLSDIGHVESYTYLDVVSADDIDPTLTKARHYLALGLGVEARNLVSGRDDTKSKIIQTAGAVLDGIPGFDLKNYTHCGIEGELWAVLGESSLKVTSRSDADLRVIIDYMRDMPPHLMEAIAVQYAIASIKSNETRHARAIWGFLEDSANQAERVLPDLRVGDHNLLLLRAMLNEKVNVELTQSIYQHLSVRDSINSLQAVEQLRDLQSTHNFSNNSNGLTDQISEVDLKSLAHQYRGQAAGREASLLLIDLEIESGNLAQAIEMTRGTFEIQDSEFEQASASVGSVILKELNKNNLPTKLMALDVYLSDIPFFDPSGLTLDLTKDAGLAAIQIGYPELAQMVYQGKEAQYASHIIDAKARQDMANGKILPDDLIPADQKLIINSIDKALAAGDKENAQRLLPKIENQEQRDRYVMLISWMESAWVSLAQSQDAPAVIDLLSSTQIITPSLSDITLQTVSQIAEKMDSDLAVGVEYLNNG